MRITASTGNDAEVFRNGEAFVQSISPEARRRFSRLTITIHYEDLAVIIKLTPRPSPAASGERGAGVKLIVKSYVDANADRVQAIARTICFSLRRGHRSWWGQTNGSAGLPPLYRGSSLPLPNVILGGIRFAVGFLLAAVALWTISALFPKLRLPQPVEWAAVLVTSIGYLSIASALVPSVELTEPVRSRLARVARWTATTLVALVVARLATTAFGG